MDEQNNKNQLDEILEIVSFMKDKGATQESVNEMHKELSDRITELSDNVTAIRSQMVTKEYLDDKLADMRGDLVV